MELYCENCYITYESKRCPVCGSKGRREITPDAPVFLVEKEQIWAPMLEDVLKQNGIPFFCKNVNGAAMSMKIGTLSERVLFFVRSKDVDAARDIVSELFSANGDEGDIEE